MKLSIVIPVYNEVTKIKKCLEIIRDVSLRELQLDKEIIVVDDGSTDGSSEIIASFECDNYTTIRNENKLGKGAAISKGISNAKGDIVIIQDADLEYDPENYELLFRPILRGEADVVYGSRFKGNGPQRIFFFWHRIANSFITFLCDMFTGLNLSDIECGYKVFTSKAIHSIVLRESDFRFEVEVTIKLARKGFRFYEVGISYYGRTYEEGKKIKWTDGLKAIWSIFKYGLIIL